MMETKLKEDEMKKKVAKKRPHLEHEVPTHLIISIT